MLYPAIPISQALFSIKTSIKSFEFLALVLNVLNYLLVAVLLLPLEKNP